MRSIIAVTVLLCLNAAYQLISAKEAAAPASNDNEADKRGGSRMTHWMDKRGGARSYGYADYNDKRAGGRVNYYQGMDKRPGGRMMSDEIMEAVKRPGGRVAYQYGKRDDDEDEPFYAVKRARSGYPSWLRGG